MTDISLGPLMTDIAGTELQADEREMLMHPDVGGVIFFARNYESPEQIAELTSAIHALRRPKLLVAVDQEGGRVQRFKNGFTRLPPIRTLGKLYDRDRKKALSYAKECGWLMAAELRSVGIDISFAPVLDLDRGLSEIIGSRAFHSNPEVIAQLAHEYMIGMREAGMAATGKHFPGHGSVKADSHLELPVDHRPLQDVLNDDLLPFERMSHYEMAAMMVAHIVYSKADPLPAGFSGYWIRDILRKEIGFQGAVFSDDLSMKATEVIGDYVARARLALEAGCDMILICNNPEGRNSVLGKISDLSDPVSHLRLVRMHGKGSTDRSKLMTSERWSRARHVLSELEPEMSLDLD